MTADNPPVGRQDDSADLDNEDIIRNGSDSYGREAIQLVSPTANGGDGGSAGSDGTGDNQLGDDDDEDEASASVRLDIGGGIPATRLYRRRWLILLLFCSYSFTSAYHWIHLNIVFDVVLAFYNESLPADPTQANLAIDWLSMIYMLAYVAFILPAAWLLQRFGLRVSAICAISLDFAGALVKCFAAAPERFWLLFFGQILCATAQTFILGMPAPLAGAWFGLDELSTATALGVFGNQLGVAAGFVIPPIFITRGETEAMGRQLLAMYIGGAVVSGLLLGLVVVLFKDKPPTPPTLARVEASALLNPPPAALVRSASSLANIARIGGGGGVLTGDSYAASLKSLASSPGFVLLTVSYGLSTGTYYGLSTLLNPIVVPEMRKAEINATVTTDIEQQVGWAGFSMIAAGILGSVLAGVVLDKTKAFKYERVQLHFRDSALESAR